jgi:hypothetical protein
MTDLMEELSARFRLARERPNSKRLRGYAKLRRIYRHLDWASRGEPSNRSIVNEVYIEGRLYLIVPNDLLVDRWFPRNLEHREEKTQLTFSEPGFFCAVTFIPGGTFIDGFLHIDEVPPREAPPEGFWQMISYCVQRTVPYFSSADEIRRWLQNATSDQLNPHLYLCGLLGNIALRDEDMPLQLRVYRHRFGSPPPSVISFVDARRRLRPRRRKTKP